MIKYILVFSLFFINGLNGNNNSNQSNPIELVQNGISITDFKNTFSIGKFIKEPLNEYGIDSENFGLTYLKNGKKIFFIWSRQNNEIISEIIVLDESLSIDGLTVGNTLNDFFRTNPNSTIEIDIINSEYEYAKSDNGEYYVEFLIEEQKVAEYSEDYTLKKIINPNSKIDRIRIHRCE